MADLSALDAMDHWVLDGHEPKRVGWEEWLDWRVADKDNEFRRVAQDTIGEAWVSTVFLSFDHGYGNTPILFETMIFNGAYSDACFRYATWDQAMAGHERVCAALRDGRDPEE